MSNTDETREILVREFPVELAADGRTIDMRVVPYNIPATVADPPSFTPYEEVWMPGAFDKQLAAANRVQAWLNFEHEQGIRGIIGHGTELRDAPDGLHGSFRVLDNGDGDKALQLVHDGVLGGISLEAQPIKTVRREGRVERHRAHLQAVALTRIGRQAFKQAEVLAVRVAPVEVEAPAMDDALAARLAALGVTPLSRIAITRRPWDGAASRFTDQQWQASCLLDRGGDAPPKTRCSLPVLEPDGALNVNALGAAAGRLNQTDATPSQKASAARRLTRYYRLAGLTAPPTVMKLAAA